MKRYAIMLRRRTLITNRLMGLAKPSWPVKNRLARAIANRVASLITNRLAIVSVLVAALSLCLVPCSVNSQVRRSTKIQGKDYVSFNDAALLLGATKFWNEEARKAVLNVEGQRVRFTVGSPIVAVGDRTFVLRAPVLFVKGTPYIPAGFFTEVVPQILAKRIAWNTENQTLSLLREGVVPVKVSLETSDEFTYLTIESPDKVNYAPVSLSQESFVVLLENAVLSGKPSSTKAGLVKQLKVAEGPRGIELRMALDPHVVGYSLQREAEPERVVVGFTSSDARMRAMGFAPLVTVPSRGMYQVVVIDPAHGGTDGGVRGKNGAIEKQITLEIARDVKDILSASGTLQVVLTRSDDSDMPAEARATKANEADGDIFVSIHCDGYASWDAKGYSVEIYRAADDVGASDSETASSAAQVSTWRNVPAQHARTSFSLARDISESLGNATGLKELGLRRVPSIALEGVDMPSTVVCCGFLTNPGDEAFLLDSSSRHKIASGVADGIVKFVSERLR